MGTVPEMFLYQTGDVTVKWHVSEGVIETIELILISRVKDCVGRRCQCIEELNNVICLILRTCNVNNRLSIWRNNCDTVFSTLSDSNQFVCRKFLENPVCH